MDNELLTPKGKAEPPKPPKTSGILKRNAVKYPSKTEMNLYIREKDQNSLSKVLPVFIILAVAIAALTKSGVIDRIQAAGEARSEFAAYRQQLDDIEAQLDDFESVREDYQRYTENYLTEDEAAQVDRLAILDLISSSSDGLAQVTTVSVSGNSVTVELTAKELSQVAEVKVNLQSYSCVTSAGVYDADTEQDADTGKQYVTASIVFDVAQEAEE